MRNNNGQKGFMLLISSVVISAILVAVVFSLSFGGFYTRFNLLDGANKEASLSLAEACNVIATLKRIQDSGYAGNETLSVGSESCNVLALEISGSEIIVKTTSTVGGAVSNMKTHLDSVSLVVNRRMEVASF